MKLENKQYITKDNNIINYYESNNDKPILMIIHAQGTNSNSYLDVIKPLDKYYHLILVDCYGHGKSSHNKEKYNLISQGNDLIEFIKTKTDNKINILGHSSGGLIASYIASKTNMIDKLILEDPPLFSSNGNRRFNTYNYVDLSSVCNKYISEKSNDDFVYYYFINQYCWNFFPEESRDKVRNKLGEFALKYRKKHPDRMLKVPFWPSKFMQGFNGLNDYDPYFGLAFYDDSFNKGIDYEELLSNIKCKTIFLKANTTIGEDGLVQGALTDEDLENVSSLIKDFEVIRFDCGHGIHNEKSKDFIKVLK